MNFIINRHFNTRGQNNVLYSRIFSFIFSCIRNNFGVNIYNLYLYFISTEIHFLALYSLIYIISKDIIQANV